MLPPGSQVGSRSPSPLRTERASFLALRSSMTNALCGARHCRCATWCIVYLSMTVGMEEDQIFPSIILMVAIPVMQFEGFLALDELSADRTAGFDHGVGHPLLLLCNAKASNCGKNKAFKILGHYAEWTKMADAVIEAKYLIW
jgi:hypothetical protein